MRPAAPNYEQALRPGPHLVLGGTGFIGWAVAALLAKAGESVIIADRSPPRFEIPEDIRDQIRFRHFDMAQADWKDLLAGVGTVHHYAWTSIPATASADPARDIRENLMPTLAMLDAIRDQGSQAPRLVFASSGGTVYGKLQRIPVPEDHPLAPITAYGVTKASAELSISQYRSSYGLDFRIARISNPFGPGQSPTRGQGAIAAFINCALSGQPIEIWGDGEVVRDYIHISDAAAGLIALASAALDEAHWTYNIATGRGVSLNGIVAELQILLDRTLDVKHTPSRPFDVPVSILDIGLARHALGWSPRLTFAEGLAQTLMKFSAE